MRTALSMPSGRDEALRKALLQRIADRLAFAQAICDGAEAANLRPTADWRCCWVSYDWPTQPPHKYPMRRFIHCLCYDDQCRHWHHYGEKLMA